MHGRSSEIATCASLVREFMRIIRQWDTVAWPHWKEEVTTSLSTNYAKHLCQSEAGLLVALQHPCSNRLLEGHLHRLRLIKRSMYGRAHFARLRLRVVNAE